MKCRIHPSDPGAGVCARCLRERLSALPAAPSEEDDTASPAHRRKPDLSSALPAHKTPQCASGDGRNLCFVKFSLLSPIWGNPSPKKVESDAIVVKSAVSNHSLLALVLKQWKKNKKKSKNILPEVEENRSGRSRKPHVPPVNGRGMSPVSKEEMEEYGGHLSTPSPLRRKTQRQQSSRRLSSYAMCLSPMMRPTLGNRWNHAPPETGFTGEVRVTFNRKCGGGGAAVPDQPSGLIPNRSRKLVDLGKFW